MIGRSLGLFMAMFLTLSGPALAGVSFEGGGGAWDPPAKSSAAPAEKPSTTSISYRDHLRDTNLKLPPECEKILLNAEESLGRELTVEEFQKQVRRILALTGEQMIQIAPVVPKPAPLPKPRENDDWRFGNCFTAAMNVLTPGGWRAIADLKVGDEVVSLDLDTGLWVRNKISATHRTPGQDFGVIPSPMGPLEVTASERFLVGEDRFGLQKLTGDYNYHILTGHFDYQPLSTLDSDATLFQAQTIPNGTFDLVPQARGSYLASGCSTVHNISLHGEPRNFVVNGLVVHNIKEIGP